MTALFTDISEKENRERYYFDYNATTPVHPEVLERALLDLSIWGNPSSVHRQGRESKALLVSARKRISDFFGVHPLEVIFTSGGSEGNNQAIKGTYWSWQLGQYKPKLRNPTILSTAVEHPSVGSTLGFLERLGVKILYIPSDREGGLDLDFYCDHLGDETLLVSVMAANSETGVRHPVESMAALARERGVRFHSDCVQLLGKESFELEKMGVDLATFSSHKFYALKGSGVLIQRQGTSLENLIHGGGQERKRRAGTENLLSILSFAHAIDLSGPISPLVDKMKKHQNFFETGILEKLSEVAVTGQTQPRLPNTSHLRIAGVEGETVLMNMDLRGFSLSAGSACQSGSGNPSNVITSMGFSESEARSSLRISWGQRTSHVEMEKLLENLVEVITKVRNIPSRRAYTSGRV